MLNSLWPGQACQFGAAEEICGGGPFARAAIWGGSCESKVPYLAQLFQSVISPQLYYWTCRACVCVWVWVMCTVWDRLTGIQVKCCCWWWWRLLLLLCSVVGNDGDEGLWHWLRLTICPRSFQSMPPVFRFCRGLIRSWLQQTATSITF